jgi:hypothetical protein
LALLFQKLETARSHLPEDGFPEHSYDEPWHLVHYTRLLNSLISEPQDHEQFFSHFTTYVDLFMACDRRRQECDGNKRELCDLWLRMLKLSISAVKQMADNKNMQHFLFDFFVSIRPSEKFRTYNNTALPAFYQILNMCCDNERFLDLFTEHVNCNWAVRYLFLEDDYPAVATVLHEILTKCASHEKYRNKYWKVLVSCTKYDINHISQFLQLMLRTQADVICFSDHKGFEFLEKVKTNHI